MHPTKNDLPAATRESMIGLLNARLADALALQLAAKQAHWNVKGPQFHALHTLFDAVAAEATLIVDELAERAVALGGTARGTAQVVAEHSELPPYPLAITRGSDHVEALATLLAALGKGLRAAIDRATQLNDADTADLFTGASRTIDKQLWFVEAHGQGDR